jgi:hypothetical protein
MTLVSPMLVLLLGTLRLEEGWGWGWGWGGEEMESVSAVSTMKFCMWSPR